MAQDNISSSQHSNFNNNQLLRKNMFIINKKKNGAIRKPSNSNIKTSISHEVLS